MSWIKKMIFSLVCASLLGLSFSGLARAAVNPAAMRVVYGFDREYAPFSYEDAGGKPVGFDIDIIESIFMGKATLAMRPLNWYSVQPELTAGTIQLTSGMVRTPQRAKAFVFSGEPTFNLKVRFFTKTFRRVPNITFFRGKAVAVEEGSFQLSMLQEFGGINIKTFPSRALALRALYNEEVDAYCGPDEPSYFIIRKLNYGAITTVGTPLASTELRIAVNRERGDILRLVNDGLRELIQSGEYDRVYRKWFITELTPGEISALRAAAKTATISSYAPYSNKNMGAALLTATGKVIPGCNVENADPEVNISAVQAALAAAVLQNELEIRAVVYVDDSGKIFSPSDKDYQALHEFGRGILVLRQDGEKLESPMVVQLYPNPVSRNIFQLEMK